jgi:protein-tyrosine phosphatase
MIDIHTHILPAVDDGSPDLESSLFYLEQISKEGVTDVFMTPHLIPGEYDNDPHFVAQQCELLREKVREKGIEINIHCGLEVYLTGSIEKIIANDNCRLAGSKYVLVETAMNGFPLNFDETLYKIVTKGFKPILAHPERYIDIIKNTRKAEDLIYRNIYLQINAGSLMGHYGKSVTKTAWELFHNGFVHFIASDFHCQSSEYFLTQAYDVLSEQYGEDVIQQFTHINPMKIIKNEEIDYFTKPVVDPATKNNTIFSRFLNLFNNE